MRIGFLIACVDANQRDSFDMESPSTVISAEDQTAIVGHLETLIADSYALMAQTHLAHWNVEGTDFFQLHIAFEEQYTELFTAVDMIAEHLRTFEAYAPGGLKMLSDMSEIGQMERRMTGKEYVAHLLEYHETLVRNAKQGRQVSGDAGDAETEDLFIERIRVHEKAIWMLKSYLR